MHFKQIDLNSWDRKPYFEHYMHHVRCTYSMTANLDITKLLPMLKHNGFRLYPALIHMLTTVVNRHVEFRMGYGLDGKVGYWESMSPSYTIFHEEDKSFSSIWTDYHKDFSQFHQYVLADLEEYGGIKKFTPKPNEPANTFPISCIPWVSFTGFNLNIYNEAAYLSPIFTIGKYFRQADSILLPLAIQMHHAVCDGYHASMLVQQMQELADDCSTWLPIK